MKRIISVIASLLLLMGTPSYGMGNQPPIINPHAAAAFQEINQDPEIFYTSFLSRLPAELQEEVIMRDTRSLIEKLPDYLKFEWLLSLLQIYKKNIAFQKEYFDLVPLLNGILQMPDFYSITNNEYYLAQLLDFPPNHSRLMTALIINTPAADKWIKSQLNSGHPAAQSSVKRNLNTIFIGSLEAGDKKNIKRLLKLGININDKNTYGDTFLTDFIKAFSTSSPAEREVYIDAIKNLIEFKADVTIPDGAGQIPLELARKTGNPEIIQLIENALAKQRQQK